MISEIASSRGTVHVPGPQGYPVVGALPQVVKHPLQFLSRVVREYGDGVQLGGFGSQQFCLITHPRDTVLQRYSLQAAPGKRVEPAAMLSLRPKGGLWMTLLERPLPS